jgi:hypothetical protein
MPTHRDYPWLREQRVKRTMSDPVDPHRDAAMVHARQVQAIDKAREATSVPPPAVPPAPGS